MATKAKTFTIKELEELAQALVVTAYAQHGRNVLTTVERDFQDVVQTIEKMWEKTPIMAELRK